VLVAIAELELLEDERGEESGGDANGDGSREDLSTRRKE
jgi:hypothetical protein